MKKNYTLKLVLAALVVVLVSLVSFVGVYKGRNLVKGYSLGRDFGQRKIAMFSVVQNEPSSNEKNEETSENKEETKNEENGEASENKEENKNEESPENKEEAEKTADEKKSEEQNSSEEKKEEEPLTEKQIKKNYEDSKNNIARRLTSMHSEEFDIRLDESNGSLVIDVPEYIDSNFLSQVVTKGKVQIKNQSSKEVIVDGNPFKDATARIDSTSYDKSIVVLEMKYTKEARKKINEANKMYTDSDGNESEATFEVVIDGNSLYSDKATQFINSANSGKLDLVMGQSNKGEDIQKDYQTALSVIAIVKCGEIPVEYQIDSIKTVSSNINVKTIIITSVIAGVVMLAYAVFRCKKDAILPVLSLIGYVAINLLVIRYTNVRVTLFTLLGIAVMTVVNYFVILKTVESKKSFKENVVNAINSIIPFIIVAVVFCCAPYLQLASFGMAMFWGLLVMCIYNAVIVRILIDK